MQPKPAFSCPLQTMMELMADKFPGCFSGYTLKVAESHQRTKVGRKGLHVCDCTQAVAWD